MNSNYVISDFATYMPMRCSMQRFGHERQQMHDYFEITLIVDGSCNLQMDEHLYRLQTGDLFCVNPHTLHNYKALTVSASPFFLTRPSLSRFCLFRHIHSSFVSAA